MTSKGARRSGPWKTGPVEDQVLADLATPEDETQPRRWVASSRVVREDTVSLIRRLHRADDGFVRFLAKTSLGEMVPIKSIRASDLHADLGKIAKRLETDAYFSVNAPYREHTTKTKHLRYLNACYADLDCYEERKTAFDIVDDLQFRDRIPPASLIVYSGRGLWLFWLLVDPKTELPPRAFQNSTLPLYNAAQEALHTKLVTWAPQLKADANATDAARISRVPGSIHSKENRRVEVRVQADVTGNGFVYTLVELTALLGIKRKTLHRPLGKSGKRVPARRKGWEARWTYLLEDIQKLQNLRRGFKEGCRNHAAFVVAYAMGKLNRPDVEIRSAVEVLAAKCRPPLSAVEVKKAVSGSQATLRDRSKHIRTQKVIAWLSVTEAEQRALRTLTMLRRRGGRAEAIQRRREALMAILIEASDDGRQPSTRALVKRLREDGIPAAKSTVAGDLRVLRPGPKRP